MMYSFTESKKQNKHSSIPEKPLKPQDIKVIRVMIWLGLVTLVLFLMWFFREDHVGYPPLYWMLTIALGFKLLRTLHEWYHYYHVSKPVKPVLTTDLKVDVFTTACPGEPHSMIIHTLEAIQRMHYPHTTYLCDEGDDPILKDACNRLGVIHVTRNNRINAKAGNINNALQCASGDICLILDPDHVPVPEFLDEVVPYFEDPKIGFVQVVQAYSNSKESLVAYGAAEQTYSFYGPMMMGMNTYGTVQAIGANCTFRRCALDSIGGHAPGLAEDMHTAMLLHAKGWKSVYIPKILTRGLVPATLAGYYKQQIKWARGTFELLFMVYPKLFTGFNWRQKIHYLTLPLYYLFGVFNLVDFLIPILSLVLAEFPWYVSLGEFLIMFSPFFFISICIRHYAQRWLQERKENGFHLFGGILRTGTWWIFVLGLIYTILRIDVPYIPTPKNDTPRNNFLLSLPNILVCALSLWAIIYYQQIYGYLLYNPYVQMMAMFALVNVAMLGIVIIIGQERLLEGLKKSLIEQPRMQSVLLPVRKIVGRTRHSFYDSIRHRALLIAILASLISLVYITLGDRVFNYVQKSFIETKAPPTRPDGVSSESSAENDLQP